VELARLFDAQITLVRVNQPVTARASGTEGNVGLLAGPDSLSELVQHQTTAAQSYLDAMAAKLASEGVRVRTHVVLQQQPADGILEEAETVHADLIAIETHGRRGLARLLWGSVADRVVRGGEVPVLLHHSPQ
jgi:nucleotide-binding universal stress UspA family protein